MRRVYNDIKYRGIESTSVTSKIGLIYLVRFDCKDELKYCDVLLLKTFSKLYFPENNPFNVILDMSCINDIDRAGMEVLIDFHKSTSSSGYVGFVNVNDILLNHISKYFKEYHPDLKLNLKQKVDISKEVMDLEKRLAA